MLCGMDLAVDAQDLLGSRDAYVICEPLTVMRKACAITRSAQRGHPGTAGSSVEVYAKVGLKAAQCPELRREDLVDIGIALEDLAKAALHHHGDAQVGA